MNTFIAQLKETKVELLKPAMELVKRVEEIALAVENVWSESLASKNNLARVNAMGNLIALRDIIYEQLDITTVKLLAFCDDHLNDRSEMNVEETANKVSVGMWASYADTRPIRKSVVFESMGIQFDLQKQLLQQHENYVFRVIRMPFVAYNMEAYDIAPNVVADMLASRSPGHVEAAPVEPPAAAAAVEGGEDPAAAAVEGAAAAAADGAEATEGGDAAGATSAAAGGGSTGNSKAVTPRAAAPAVMLSPRSAAQEARLPTRYVVGDLILFDILYTAVPAFHLRVRKWTMRSKAESATKLRKSSYPSSVPSRMQLKIAEDILMTDDMRVAVWSEELRDWTEEGISDYQYNESTRTVHFYITTVGVLALVKRRVSDMPLRSWTLAPMLSKPLNGAIARKMSAVDPTAGVEEDMAAAIEKLSLTATKAPSVSSIISGSVPDDESVPKSAVDAEADKATKARMQMASVGMDAATVSTLPKDTFERCARFTVHTQGQEVVIDIVGSYCKLMKPMTPVFADILDVLMNPGTLLRKLQKKGVNLLPNAVDLAIADRVITKVKFVMRGHVFFFLLLIRDQFHYY
jgi:hypothetical protein